MSGNHTHDTRHFRLFLKSRYVVHHERSISRLKCITSSIGAKACFVTATQDGSPEAARGDREASDIAAESVDTASPVKRNRLMQLGQPKPVLFVVRTPMFNKVLPPVKPFLSIAFRIHPEHH